MKITTIDRTMIKFTSYISRKSVCMYISLTLVSIVLVSSSPVGHLESSLHTKCVHGNRTYLGGEKFKPSSCMYCHCPHKGGRVRCAVKDCIQDPGCLQYEQSSDDCCGTCVLYGCQSPHGADLHPGQRIWLSPCEVCQCPTGGGMLACQKRPACLI